MRGSKCDGNSDVKVASRLNDIFVGRVNNEVLCEDLKISKTHIYDVFQVSNLVIITNEYKAFRVPVRPARIEKSSSVQNCGPRVL